MLVGVVACAAFACYSVVQGEAAHGEVVCVAGIVLEDDPALDKFVDAAADGALVHLKHLAGCLAIQQEAVVFTDKRNSVVPGHIVAADLKFGLYTFLNMQILSACSP